MRLLLWLLVFLHLLGCGEGIFKDDSVESHCYRAS